MTTTTTEPGTELIPSISIENLLNQRQGILERFQQMQALATEIKQLIGTFQNDYPPEFTWKNSGKEYALIDRYRNESEENRVAYTQAIDAMGWRLLMRESGNLSLMDAKARQEWHDSLTKEVPELTFENIKATFQDLHASRKELFHRGVLNVFKGLSKKT